MNLSIPISSVFYYISFLGFFALSNSITFHDAIVHTRKKQFQMKYKNRP